MNVFIFAIMMFVGSASVFFPVIGLILVVLPNKLGFFDLGSTTFWVMTAISVAITIGIWAIAVYQFYRDNE